MNLLSIVQVIVAILLVVSILLQQRGGGLGGAFGSEGGGFYGASRGFQQKLYWATIILGISFIGLALLGLLL